MLCHADQIGFNTEPSRGCPHSGASTLALCAPPSSSSGAWAVLHVHLHKLLWDAVVCRYGVLPRALLAFVPAENMHLPYHPFALRGRHHRLLPTLVCVFTLRPLYALASAHMNTLMEYPGTEREARAIRCFRSKLLCVEQLLTVPFQLCKIVT